MTQLTILQYAEPTQDELTSCQGFQKRVALLLEYYADAREDDIILLELYAKFFGSTQFNESTIKRCGRKWREVNQYKVPLAVRIRKQRQRKAAAQYWQQSMSA